MKKIAGIAATLAMATAFCGFCTGVAANVTANAETTPTPSVSTSAIGATPKVILNPGAFYNNAIEASAASKVTKLTATEEAQYFVENAYFANYTAGEALPKATTTRSGVTFVGWRYAVDGETKVVTTMPTVTDDLYLYAHWSSGANPTPTPGPEPTPGPTPSGDIVLTGTSAAFKFNDATIVITLTAKASWGDPNSEEVYIGSSAADYNNASNHYKLDGSSTYTINTNVPAVIYVGFTQYTTQGKYAAVTKSEIENGKVHTVTAVNYDSASGWEGDNWKHTLTKTNITYSA